MNFRYLVIFSSVLILGCQSAGSYESTAGSYEECKEMLSNKSHPLWDQAVWIQEIETGLCKQLILETELNAVTNEPEQITPK